MTTTLRPSRPFLDEAGHVYLPLAGPARSCLRLNRVASELFRSWLAAPVDRDALSEVERAFMERLIACGAIEIGDRPS